MRTIKIILLALFLVICLPLIASLFLHTESSAVKSVVINRSQQDIFDYIVLLKNQEEFSAWAKMDPEMKREFRGEDGKVGFVSAWEGNQEVGKGEQEIKKITPPTRIDYELRFKEPFEDTSFAYLELESKSNNETIVKWGFNSTMARPMNVMLLLMDFEEMIGKDLQTGLDNLKTILEK
jgi:hypothetical protein